MIKQGASIDKCRAEILKAYIKIIQPIYKKRGLEAVITSGSEPYKHSAKRSRHYSGDAIDLRSKTLGDKKYDVLAEIQLELGPDFVVVLECAEQVNEHFHIHYAPVYSDGS